MQYDGSVDSWNGGIWIHDEPNSLMKRNGKCSTESHTVLALGAGLYFEVVKGFGEFQPADPGDRIVFHRSHEVSYGYQVLPRCERVSHSHFMVQVNEAFDVLVDVVEYFEVDQPGVYTVFWGIEGLADNRVVFEVVSGLEYGGLGQ